MAEIYCDYMHIHPLSVQEVKNALPPDEILFDLADLFKLFGDTTRLKILSILAKRELCVCDISLLLGMSQSAISHQLKVLKSFKLVKCRRAGKTVFYSLADDHVESILQKGFEHIFEGE